jgi:hypothetical protein
MTELHTSHDAHRFKASQLMFPQFGDLRDPTSLAAISKQGVLLLQEGKYFHQFDDRWGEAPRFVVPCEDLRDKPDVTCPSRFYRFALRKIASSTNERTGIMAMLMPGVAFADSTISEKNPKDRKGSAALAIVSLFNCYVFDWLLRQKVGANVNAFLVEQVVVPQLRQRMRLLSHTALRLTCNHSGYAPLWREQLGDAWREDGKPPMTWPVLAGDEVRWAVRAAIDAVVADAYGLSRNQYAHVLSAFSHASYRKAPELCLARFDELKKLGLEKFTRKHDPYWDIPLNENLPQPVIDLPIPTDEATEETTNGLWKERSGQVTFLSPGPLFDAKIEKPAKRGRKKK